MPSIPSPVQVGPSFDVIVSDILDGTDDDKRAKRYALMKQVGREPTQCAEILRKVYGNPNPQILGQGTFGFVTVEGSYASNFAKVS